MSKVKDELIAILEKRHGITARNVVEDLYKAGALDDSLCRTAVVVERFHELIATTCTPQHEIEHSIAMMYGTSRSTVQYTLRKRPI
jgi:hypothetical protein